MSDSEKNDHYVAQYESNYGSNDHVEIRGSNGTVSEGKNPSQPVVPKPLCVPSPAAPPPKEK